jgi:hypothetical protein
MKTIPQVESAKALMTEAISWSVVKWLREKKRVRKAADQANAALDEMRQAVKERWPEDTRSAYELLASEKSAATNSHQRRSAVKIAPETTNLARKIKEADDEAYGTRMEAEQLFDDAEKQLSTSLARDGCRRAIQAWELCEQAIRKSEAAITSG